MTQCLGGRFSVRMRSATAPKDVDERWDAIFGRKGRKPKKPAPKTVVLVAKEIKSALHEVIVQSNVIRNAIVDIESGCPTNCGDEITSAAERINFIAKTLHDGVK